MNSHEIVKQVQTLAAGRFDVVKDEDLTALAGKELKDVMAIKVRRTTSATSTARTVLLAFINKAEHWPSISRWTATVRDMLPEPDTSDLYLFLVAEGFTDHNCWRIESDEQFCRKYVSNGLDFVPMMLARTFLAPLTSGSSEDEISDPVSTAFAATQKTYPWLSALQKQWRDAFITELPGKDMVPQITETQLDNGLVNGSN